MGPGGLSSGMLASVCACRLSRMHSNISKSEVLHRMAAVWLMTLLGKRRSRGKDAGALVTFSVNYFFNPKNGFLH